MLEPAFLVLLGLFFGAIAWASLKKNADRLQAWNEALVSCGLQVLYSSVPLEAWTGRLMVRIEYCGNQGQSTRVVIVVPGPPDFIAVRIRPEPIHPWGREIEVGDVSFDSTFFIEGPAPLVFALLDAETRRLLFHVSTASQVEISSGKLRAEMSDEKVPDLLPLLVDAGQRLAQSVDVDIPRRLAENAQGDPAPGVRLQNLLLLVRELPGDPGTLEALRTACSDPSPEIRLRAGKELGAEGRGVLLELAESLVNDIVSAEAVATLERELPFESLKSILTRAARGRRLRTARACLEALGRRGAAEAVGVLVEVMEQEEGELAAVAAWALGAIGSPAAEPSLIQALRRDLVDLRVFAAKALGRVGSVAAVLPLKEAAERSWRDLELHRAARQAIAEIQSRLPGASPGQLSLAGAEAGQLSLAGAEAGQLSIAADSAGQLSLTVEPRRSE